MAAGTRHGQIFGWIGTFILGIGYYSIPKLRGGMRPYAIWSAWLTGILWMSGVLLRWLANVYGWHWRAVLPTSASLELLAFLMSNVRFRSADNPGLR